MYTPHGSVLSHPVAGVDGPVISLGMYRPDLVATLAAGLPGGVLHTGFADPADGCSTVQQAVSQPLQRQIRDIYF